MDYVAPALALLSGAMFGFNVHIQHKGLAYTDALTGALVSVGAMAGLLWLLSPFVIEWHWWHSQAAFLFALCGLFFPAMGQRLSLISIAKIGPALTSAFGALTPFFAILPAVLFLGEIFRLQDAIGLAAIIAGMVLVAINRGDIRRTWPLWALLLSVGASASRGIAQPIAKIGMVAVASPFFATLVMASVSTIVLGLFVALRKKQPSKSVPARGLFWFALGGATNGAGILILNTAINQGDISVAAPLATTAPLWTLLFGALIFRTERLGIKLVLKARTTAPDEDNTSAAMKAYLDGMAQAMGVDDKIFKPQPVEFGERTRNGAVIFTVEPVVAQKPETT